MIKKLIIIFCALLILTSTFGLLLYNGVIWFNNPSKEAYPVRGVDVSIYQGDIDWNVLSNEGIDFAFMKATEGSGFVDENFKFNLENAMKTSLKIGAYHFFSFESPGETQGENFIENVPNHPELLPPVVDIEFYGDFINNPPSKEKTEEILNPLIEKLKNHYGKPPIIYATYDSYDLYIKGSYKDCPIWIRDIIKKPTLSDNREWTFWQYSNREKLNGYAGVEKFIDMNVFNGSLENFYTLFNLN